MKKFGYALASLYALSQVCAVADQGQGTSQPVLEMTVVREPTAVITPSISDVADGYGLYFNADFIWWKPVLTGTAYAGTGAADGNVNVPTFTSPEKGRIATPDYSFQPGFKLGAGVDARHDGWDLYAQWTWLNPTDSHSHLDSKPGLGEQMTTVTVLPTGQQSPLPIISANSKWKQKFNILDLELGRNFYISHRIAIRPFGGLKTAWITEDIVSRYVTTDNITALGSQTYKINQHRHQHMWGIGMRLGMDSLWHLNQNWGVYGDFAFTALWSDFHVRAKDNYNNTVTGLEFKDLHTRITTTPVNLVVEMGMGLTYMTWCCNDKYQFRFKAGWEEQIWFNMVSFYGLNQSANLSLQGLTLSAAFGF